MTSIKILNTETLSDNKYLLQNITFEIRDRDGHIQSQKREVYIRPQGAALLLYNPSEKKILISKQFRLPAFLIDQSGDIIEACAGIIDENETPDEAVVREAEEELGYRVPAVMKIGEVYPTPGAVSELIHLYIGMYSADMKVNDGGGNEHEGENIEAIELTFDEARNMLKNQEFKDAKTIILIQHAIINGFL